MDGRRTFYTNLFVLYEDINPIQYKVTIKVLLLQQHTHIHAHTLLNVGICKILFQALTSDQDPLLRPLACGESLKRTFRTCF